MDITHFDPPYSKGELQKHKLAERSVRLQPRARKGWHGPRGSHYNPVEFNSVGERFLPCAKNSLPLTVFPGLYYN
jgi:hypothetical protein